MASRKRIGLRWLGITVLGAVVGAAAYETIRNRLGWRGWL